MRRNLLWSAGLALLLVLLPLSSCGQPAPVTTPTPTPVPTATPAPVLTWSEQVFAKEYTAQDGTVVMTTRYTLPDIQDASLKTAWQAIHNFYAKEGAELEGNAAEQEEWALGDYDSASATGFPFQPYTDQQSYEFTRRSDQWISVLRTHAMNSGEADTTTFLFTDLFDLFIGVRLTLADCFDTDAQTAQDRVLEEVLRLNEAGAYGEVFSQEEVEAAFDPALFYFTDEGLVIPFQIYAVDRHPALIPQQAIPYSNLEDINCIW